MPTHPLFGGIVADLEMEALLSVEADLSAQLRIEAALAEAAAESGLIEPDAATAIVAACQGIVLDRDALGRAMTRDGVVVPGLVEQLRAAVGELHGKSVHWGATSQDIIDTSFVLRLAECMSILDTRLADVAARLAALEERDGAGILMGRTRMQVALPITARDKIATWRLPLLRHRLRLAELRPRVLLVQLGGPVGTRAELGRQAGVIAASLAARLGLAEAAPWHSQRDGVVEFGSWLSLVAGSLGKFGQDVALLAQNEVASVRFSGGGTSSAMAHKHNPVAAERLVTLARFNAGQVGTLHQALVHENERSGAAWTLEWMVLPSMVLATGTALLTASALLHTLAFQPSLNAP